VERRGDDHRPLDAALEQERQRPRGVLGGRLRRRLEDELRPLGPVPEAKHLLRLGDAAGRRPTAEDDHARPELLRQPLRLGDELPAGCADVAAPGSPAVARHDDG
jgi:hypothetical protein